MLQIINELRYPYFNIGLQGVNSPTIRRNTILGSGHEMSGGIAIWNASSAVIEENLIDGCGYGILCFQTGASPTIRGNTIADDLHVFDNKGPVEKFVQDNSGGDEISCFGNEDPFTASGNTGFARSKGQCEAVSAVSNAL